MISEIAFESRSQQVLITILLNFVLVSNYGLNYNPLSLLCLEPLNDSIGHWETTMS